jgi:hypothetical protein
MIEVIDSKSATGSSRIVHYRLRSTFGVIIGLVDLVLSTFQIRSFPLWRFIPFLKSVPSSIEDFLVHFKWKFVEFVPDWTQLNSLFRCLFLPDSFILFILEANSLPEPMKCDVTSHECSGYLAVAFTSLPLPTQKG